MARSPWAGLALLLAFAPAVVLAGEPPIKAGDGEVDFSGAFSRTRTTNATPSSSTDAFLAARYGYLFTENHELGLLASVDWVDASGGHITLLGGGAFYDLNFPLRDSPVVPVIGVSAEAEHASGFSGHAFDASAGIRVFASKDVSINCRFYYEKARSPVIVTTFFGSSVQGVDTNSFGLRLGFSWFLH